MFEHSNEYRIFVEVEHSKNIRLLHFCCAYDTQAILPLSTAITKIL